MRQLDFFRIVHETSYDWKNHPDPEMVFGDLDIGDRFQVITWVKSGWRVISVIYTRVEQPTVLHPNSIGQNGERTSLFKDVPVTRLVAQNTPITPIIL